jgi:CRP-like cAMP-binding protein
MREDFPCLPVLPAIPAILHLFILYFYIMFEGIRASLKSFGNFSEEQLSELFSRLRHRNVKKGEHLIREGDICRSFYFVRNGAFRHYTILDSGVEANINLFVENEWIFDYKSFMSQTPSENIVEASTDSEVFALGAQDFHELVKISDGFFRLGRILEQAVQNQEYQNNRISPEEKYGRLLASKPQVFQKFPLKHIASFLGVTPETLSRIRRKLIS